MRDNASLPAALGGTPLRSQGPPEWPGNRPAVVEHLVPLLTSGAWGKYHGPECAGLIAELQQRIRCEHVILCSSGTAAVELALRGCPITAGDEVLLAGYDFPGNFRDVLIVGGIPRLVDIRAEDAQLDIDLARQAISPRTKAVIASHLHGGCVDIPALAQAARTNGIIVIEDACQAVGGSLNGEPLGSLGDISVLSFGGSKLLSAGRGGAVLTSRADIAQRIRLYQQRGNEAYPLSELQAALLRPQLSELDALHRRRAQWVQALHDSLSGEDVVRMLDTRPDRVDPAYYKLGFRYDAEASEGLNRDRFAEAMRAEGFAVWPGFRALHRCHAKGRYQAPGPLVQCERADESLLILHHPILLEPPESVQQFVEAVRRIRRHATALRDAAGLANLNDNDE